MNKKKAKKLSKKFTKLTGIECNTTFMKKGEIHTPTTLPSDKKGVYVFLLSNKICFKVGKAGSGSQARWNSQHYNLDINTPSTFTKSFLSDLDNFKEYFNDEQKEEIESFKKVLLKNRIENLKEDIKNIKKLSKESKESKEYREFEKKITLLNEDLKLKDWIKNNIDRIEFLIPASDNDFDLNLLEALIQFELKPIYEGRNA